MADDAMAGRVALGATENRKGLMKIMTSYKACNGDFYQ